jgi:hypothetical protein
MAEKKREGRGFDQVRLFDQEGMNEKLNAFDAIMDVGSRYGTELSWHLDKLPYLTSRPLIKLC